MRKLAVLLSALTLLAGCANSGGYGEARPEPAAAAVQPNIAWRTVLAGDVVEVELTDPKAYYRVERIELVGPAGQTYTATTLTRETVREDAGPYGSGIGVGIGGYGGSSSGAAVGLGLSFPLGSASQPAPTVTRTIARIRVPDADAYRRTAGQWTINAYLSDPAGTPSLAKIPAPTPVD
ncbi:MAG: hypothetical protein V3T93_00035 [Alphaproteobacteria bacterium]